ncbi:hypothetical protein SM130_17320 [Stutzerimonas stutzeri]
MMVVQSGAMCRHLGRLGCTERGGSPALQPNRIPRRIIANPLNQPGPQRVGNDVPRCLDHVFILAQCTIMKASLPDPRTRFACNAVDGYPTAGLEALDYPSAMAVRNSISQCTWSGMTTQANDFDVLLAMKVAHFPH